MKTPHIFSIPAPVRVMALTSTLAIFLSGCASTPVPTEQMAVAEAAVSSASSSNTSKHAPGELQVAISKLDRARAALAREDYMTARQMAEQAEVDAQVARVRSQSVSAGKAASESEEAARVLREEINRKSAN
jgi:hypothetical protein